jgi:hypothetical protein
MAIFGLVEAIEAPAVKKEPARVTENEEPVKPELGLMEASVGGAAFTVNGTVEEVPPELETVTLNVPAVALAAITKFAVICEALTTTTLVTVTPGLETVTLEPDIKLAPARVTGTVAPWLPADGVTEVRDGAGGLTVKVAGPLTPLELETVMVEAPSEAVGASNNVAVI